VVPPASHGIPRAPRYSGSSPTPRCRFAYGAVTRSGRPSQTVRLPAAPRVGPRQWPPRRPTTPGPQRLPPWHGPGLGRAPFAHHYLGPRCCFLLLGVLRCFSSPGSPHRPMDSDGVDPASPGPSCLIRTPAALRPSTAPRGFSQSPASFFGPWRLGIPRALSAARHTPTGPSRALRIELNVTLLFGS
jgi:hypothetical protein